MTVFGQDLKTHRERLGVSLEAVAAETKVAPRHLLALEKGDLGQLPGGVVRRGIVRAYLHAVHLEEEPWMLRFQAAIQQDEEFQGQLAKPREEAWATFARNVERGRTRVAARSGPRWLGVLFLLILVIAAALMTWHFILHKNLPL
jgi:cytoskeleton protein RodZ